MKDYVGLKPARVFQVIGVKHERFAFDIKNPPERALSFAIGVCVINVHDVQVSGSDEIPHLGLGGFQVKLTLQTRFSYFELGPKLLAFILLCSKLCLGIIQLPTKFFHFALQVCHLAVCLLVLLGQSLSLVLSLCF